MFGAPKVSCCIYAKSKVASGLQNRVVTAGAPGLPRFDLPAFYAEVRRVLRPSGALAIWGYDL